MLLLLLRSGLCRLLLAALFACLCFAPPTIAPAVAPAAAPLPASSSATAPTAAPPAAPRAAPLTRPPLACLGSGPTHVPSILRAEIGTTTLGKVTGPDVAKFSLGLGYNGIGEFATCTPPRPPVPYVFKFDPISKTALCRFDGEVTDDEFRNFYLRAGEFVEENDPLAGIVDFSAVTLFDVSPQTILGIAQQPPAMPCPDRPRVMVAPAPIAFAMMRMFEIVGGRTRPSFRVVRTLQEAWTYLGVCEPGLLRG